MINNKMIAAVLTLSILGAVALLAINMSAAQEDQPTIAKDSIQATAFQVSSYKGSYDTWSWVPRMEYRVNGPIPSGSQLYVQFTLPSGPWVKFDCKTGEAQKGYWWKTECGARDIPEDKGTTYTGPVSFTIKMRNELAGTDTTLFTGKANVVKVASNESGPKAATHMAFYVDQDWNLPIGYVFLQPNDISGWKLPGIAVTFWSRGAINASMEPHLFHGGKEVGKKFMDSDEVGKAGCNNEIELDPTMYTKLEGRFVWIRWQCQFPNVKAWDKTGEGPGMFGPPYLFSQNPGEYEMKVLYQGHLVRSIKFSVDSEGKLVDNGIANTFKLGSNRIIVPAQVMGESDGQWDRAAWKNAFYGNPLTGFTPSP